MEPEPRHAVDLGRLQEVTQGDAEFEQILLDAYLEDSAQQLATMQKAAAEGSSAQLSAAAHSLKGASANIGANEVQNICAATERMDPRADAEGVAMLLAQLVRELDGVRQFIEQYRAGR